MKKFVAVIVLMGLVTLSHQAPKKGNPFSKNKPPRNGSLEESAESVGESSSQDVEPRKRTIRVGDMEMTVDQLMETFDNLTFKIVQTGIVNEADRTAAKSYRWPKDSTGFVNVPYQFNAIYTAAQKNYIKSQLVEIMAKTCIKFIPYTNQANYIHVFDDSGCYSMVGKQGGQQKLSLARNGCLNPNAVKHEFIHALGYTHMHNHVNRDNFITLNTANIQNYATDANMRYQFLKVKASTHSNFNTNYDYYSIMHYGRKFFSSNGLDTMMPKGIALTNGTANLMGSTKNLSDGDVLRINRMYNCAKTGAGTVLTTTVAPAPAIVKPPCKWVVSLYKGTDVLTGTHFKYLCYIAPKMTYANAKAACVNNGMKLFQYTSDTANAFAESYKRSDLTTTAMWMDRNNGLQYCSYMLNWSMSSYTTTATTAGANCKNLYSTYCQY